jgi:hypothetical protein
MSSQKRTKDAITQARERMRVAQQEANTYRRVYESLADALWEGR